jgi:hypothetical protein
LCVWLGLGEFAFDPLALFWGICLEGQLRLAAAGLAVVNDDLCGVARRAGEYNWKSNFCNTTERSTARSCFDAKT